MTSPDPKLKPCPMCGGKAEEPTDEEGVPLQFVECTNCGMAYASKIEFWNKAYCWKEIDSLRAELARKDEILETIKRRSELFENPLPQGMETMLGLIHMDCKRALRPEEGGKEKI